MSPEVLIVGDVARRTDLLARIQDLGYEAEVCTADVLYERVRLGRVPAAVVVCTDDVDSAELMADLRRTRRGSGVPVTLHGPLGGRTGDLADVLDLGADHFLEEPADDEQLAVALEELVGPGIAPVARSKAPARARRSGRAAPRSTERAAFEPTEDVERPRERARTRSPTRERARHEVTEAGADDTVIGQLHRTLDLLEARLREREDGDGEVDDLDLTDLGLGAMPEVDDGEPERAPQHQTPGSSLEASLLQDGAPERSEAQRGAPERGPEGRRRRDSTERLGSEREAPAAPEATRTVQAPADRPRRRVPLPIEDRGSLEHTEVPRLLWVLHRAGYSGALVLQQGRVEKRSWWRDGALAFVRSNVGRDRLVDGLLRRGLITRQQYEQARRLAADEPRREGPRLVEAGLLKASELPRVLRHHLARVLDSTFAWTDGTWVLDPEDEIDETVMLDVSVPRLVAEGVRHRMDGAQLRARLGGLDQFPRFRPEAAVAGGPAQLARRLGMSAAEEAWLLRLDGAESLRTLLAVPDSDERELLDVAYVLHVLGHLELYDERAAAPSQGDPLAVDLERIRDRLRQGREGDYFAVLGLRHDATELEVRRSHAELMQTFADEALEPSVPEILGAELVELRDLLDEAHDVLADSTLRSAYLAHLSEETEA